MPFDINEFLRDLGALGVLAFSVWNVFNSQKAATQDRMYAHYTEICKLFMAKPYLRPYFYDQAVLSGPSQEYPQLRSEIDFMSETILGLIEHAVMQRKHMPKDSWEHCWLPYAKERVSKSAELAQFFAPNAGWYTHKLCEVMNTIRPQIADPR
jgi:hypothetical protein